MKRVIVSVAMLLAAHLACAEDLYRWVDKEGKVHYGDLVPSEIEDAEAMKFSNPSAASGVDQTSFPYESRVAATNFPVVLYVTEHCGDVCKQARDLLAKRHVPYSEVTLKTQDEMDSFKKKSGANTVPTASVGKDWLRGFENGQWQDELDAAGYPKAK